jgi:hypothetical protein
MDTQQIIESVLAACGVMGAWVLNTLWNGIKHLENEVKEINREINQEFVRREDFREAIRDLKDMLNKIFDRLDTKVDKHDQ